MNEDNSSQQRELSILKTFGVTKRQHYWEYTNGKPFHYKNELTDELLLDHINGTKIIGVSPFLDDNNVKNGAIDFDAHLKDDMPQEEKDAIIKQVIDDSNNCLKFLQEKGFLAMMNASGGSVGRHIRVFQKGLRPIDARAMKIFLMKVQEEVFGKVKYEIFPVQSQLGPDTPFGNQMKLFMGVHHKTHNRTDLIVDGKQLSKEESVEYLNNILLNADKYKEIVVSQSDYDILEPEPKEIVVSEGNVPMMCAFMEQIATKVQLPSGIKKRHHYLDPNLTGYTEGRPDKKWVRDEYKKMQNKEDSALDNWKGYWMDGKPVFKCGQIIAFEMHYKTENKACADGLKLCTSCPYFREHKRNRFGEMIQNLDTSNMSKLIDDVTSILEMLLDQRDGMLTGLVLPAITKKTGIKAKVLNEKIRELKGQLDVEMDVVVGVEGNADINKDMELVRLRKRVLSLIEDGKVPQACSYLADDFRDKNHIYTTRYAKMPECWIYQDGIYIPEGETYIEEYVKKILDRNYSKFYTDFVVNIIKPETYVDAQKFFRVYNPNRICCLNGILDIIEKKLYPFNPEEIHFNKINVKFDPEAKCPAIEKFISEVLEHEDDFVMYELIGYALKRDLPIEKAFMFTAEGRNGKSKMIEMIKNFLGVENCTNISLDDIQRDDFAKSNLMNKMANLSGDISGNTIKSTGDFKSLTGNDMITANRKFKQRVDFQNYAKMIYSANQLPKTLDTTTAFFNRWLLFEFPFTFLNPDELVLFTEEEQKKKKYKLADTEIIKKITLEIELSGLLNKALDGLAKVLEQKNFSSSPATHEVKMKWIRKSDSVSAFVTDEIVIDLESNTNMLKSDFKRHYASYCKKYKLKAMGDKEIGKSMERLGIGEDKINNGDSWEFVWTGISLK